MNKKFSTLLTAGLLIAGALFSDASAEKLIDLMAKDPATKVEGGKEYFLVQQVQGVAPYAGYFGVAFGMTALDLDTQVSEPTAQYVEHDLGSQDPKLFRWTVSEQTLNGKTFVKFTNAKTGKVLTILKSGTGLVTDYDDATQTKDATNLWAWTNDGKNYETAVKNAGKAYLGCVDDALTITKGFYFGSADGFATYNINADAFSGTGTDFKLYEAGEKEVDDDELNELYNTAGFNFEIKDGVENIFDNGQKIQAIKLVNPVLKNAGDTKFGFPAGTYFVTETPDGAYADADDQLDYLLNSTFIAVSADENASTSADKQKAGEGFTLTTVFGKDLNLFIAKLNSEIEATPASQQTKGSEVSVLNAAFTVKENIAAQGKYALSLDRIRIQEAASADKHVYKTGISLQILSDKSYNSNEVLVTKPSTTSSFIFKFVKSTVAEGKSFINADGPSIYNIRFVAGPAKDSYLTSAYHNGSVANFAKGIVLTDAETPAFQYVVTKVNDNDVTFTNRETGESFTAQLFPEDGENVYSLAISADVEYTPLNINNNGDVVEGTDKKLNLAWVELIPVAEVDKFAGFWNVDDETQVTLAFARDNTPTSNKIYPVAKEASSVWSWENKMTDEVSEAAQLQLLKSEKPTYKTYTYAYLNDAEKIVYKTKGDTVAYYTYEINLVNDGLATNYKIDNNNYALNTSANNTFMIKENVDGSVYIITTLAAGSGDYMSVTTYADGKLNNLNRTLSAVKIAQTSAATDIKTYLVQDAPEVSLSAEATYVSFKSEKGNYISMEEDRDGIVVNSEPMVIRLFSTDLTKTVPSFYITTGWDKETEARMFMMHPEDSVNYYVGAGDYDKKYQWAEGKTKAIFKSALLNATNDTLTTTIKGKVATIAAKADNKGVQGGLECFKNQIVLANADDADDLYIIRSMNADAARYLTNINDQLAWTDKRSEALKVFVETEEMPTANEGINAASAIKVVATDGAVIIKGAEGKKVVVSNVLGQTIANTVVTSSEVTITAPKGYVTVAVEGEAAVKAIVK